MKVKAFHTYVVYLPTFLLILSCFYVLLSLSSNLQLFMSILFILLHECGHLVAAKVAGYKIDKRTLLIMPFGISFGFSKRFISPLHDIFVSAAGPITNLMLAILFYQLSQCGFVQPKGLFVSAVEINLVLGVFNLLPAGFLDGGRIARAVLAHYSSFYYACVIVNIAGIALGFLMVIVSIYGGIRISAISLFLLGVVFVINSVVFLKRNVIMTLNYILNKDYNLHINKGLKIKFVCYSKNTKLLDIIKNFCFNKYYVIYIIEDNNLRYNINEADLICLFYKYGNIKLEDCVYYTKEQEGENG